MKRWLATIAFTLLWVLPMAADVTIVTTTTIEGAMMGAMQGGGKDMVPRVVTRIKGTKGRTEIEIGTETMVTLTDLVTKEAYLLRPAQKTAQPLGAATAGMAGKFTLPKIDSTVKPTGKTREISGQPCDEFTIEMRMDMSTMSGPNLPPEAATMLKDVRMVMRGVAYVAKSAPGSAEYQKFQASAAKMALGAMAGAGSGQLPAGLQQVLSGFAEAPGIPYETELTMNVEGTGPMVDVMKQMGKMKITNRVSSVSTEPLADTLFRVPEDYKIIK